MDYLNEAEIQGAEIDDNSEIDMVLKSLLKTSKAFFNYNINKKNMTLIELMNELHLVEEIYRAKNQKEVLTLLKKMLLLSLSKKARAKRRKLEKKKPFTKKYGKPKGNYIKYGQKSHWKKDYTLRF